jgi:hypothetical protein
MRQEQPLAVAAYRVGRHRTRCPVALHQLHHARNCNVKTGCASRQLAPARTAATARSRRSFERGRVIDAGLRPASILNHCSPKNGIPRDSANALEGLQRQESNPAVCTEAILRRHRSLPRRDSGVADGDARRQQRCGSSQSRVEVAPCVSRGRCSCW